MKIDTRPKKFINAAFIEMIKAFLFLALCKVLILLKAYANKNQLGKNPIIVTNKKTLKCSSLIITSGSPVNQPYFSPLKNK